MGYKTKQTILLKPFKEQEGLQLLINNDIFKNISGLSNELIVQLDKARKELKPRITSKQEDQFDTIAKNWINKINGIDFITSQEYNRKVDEKNYLHAERNFWFYKSTMSLLIDIGYEIMSMSSWYVGVKACEHDRGHISKRHYEKFRVSLHSLRDSIENILNYYNNELASIMEMYPPSWNHKRDT